MLLNWRGQSVTWCYMSKGIGKHIESVRLSSFHALDCHVPLQNGEWRICDVAPIISCLTLLAFTSSIRVPAWVFQMKPLDHRSWQGKLMTSHARARTLDTFGQRKWMWGNFLYLRIKGKCINSFHWAHLQFYSDFPLQWYLEANLRLGIGPSGGSALTPVVRMHRAYREHANRGHLSSDLYLTCYDQTSWLQTQRSWVWFPALSDFLCSSGSGTGSTQPLWG
jgi:hypothetical protein